MLGDSSYASLAQVTAGFRILRTGPIQSFLFKRMAVSSSKCNGCLMIQLRKYFHVHGPDRIFLGSSVHLMRNGIELTLGVVRQIGALRQILLPHPIGVLVGDALPGTLRIGKADADGKSLR